VRGAIACALLVLLIGCGKEPASVATPPPSASSRVAPPPSAEVASPDAAPVHGANANASTWITGRLVRLVAGKEPAVVISVDAGELSVRGVDGKVLGWAEGDEIRVDGPKPENGSIDCTDPTQCSIGLASGGDLILRDVDAHSALALIGSLVPKLVLVGPSRRASVELRYASENALIRAFARAVGLGVKPYRGLILLARPKLLEATRPVRIVQSNPKIDLSLVGAELYKVNRLMADVSKRRMNGIVDGQISFAVRSVESADVIDAYFALCGVSAKTIGNSLELLQTGKACSEYVVPEPRCMKQRAMIPPLQKSVIDRLSCVAPGELRILASSFVKGLEPTVVLGSGAPRGDEMTLRKGDLFGAPEYRQRADTKLELYWRVSHIRRESVELELSDPAEPSSEDKRLVIPFR